MSSELLTTEEAARRLAISRATLYDWMRQSNGGSFAIRGQAVSIDYYQGGGKGQGRIKIEAEEIERLLSLMRVAPMPAQKLIRPTKKQPLRYINVKLGRPEE